jgi:GNAT superfamily N-acetyltransferase
MQVNIAGPDQLQSIATMAETIWNAYYPAIISEEQIRYMLERGYSNEALNDQQKAGHCFYLLEDGDEKLGYASISEETTGHCFLHKFYLQLNLHGKGHGSYFMTELESRCAGIKSMKLTVNRKNIRAINFYFSRGFRIDHAADFDIGSGYFMNDFVMVKTY